jgi:phosphoribosylformylglycinamidine synthase
MKARVTVTLKSGVLDPQGQAIGGSLRSLGFDGVTSVRQGKIFDIDMGDADPVAARATLTAMCERLLANTVIENYAIETNAPELTKIWPTAAAAPAMVPEKRAILLEDVTSPSPEPAPVGASTPAEVSAPTSSGGAQRETEPTAVRPAAADDADNPWDYDSADLPPPAPPVPETDLNWTPESASPIAPSPRGSGEVPPSRSGSGDGD